jgi:hypothetical protein
MDNSQCDDDDEHRLIARYTARLAADANNAIRSPGELCYGHDANQIQRQLIAQLEAKNRDIMSEICHLRQEQERQAQVVLSHSTAGAISQTRNPILIAELRNLRQRRDDLERRMSGLQSSRRELMLQLETLMTLLRTTATSNRHVTPSGRVQLAITRGRQHTDQLATTGGSVIQAFRPTATVTSIPGCGYDTLNAVCGMRNSLLVAADSVTDAVSSLVRELNSDVSSGSDEGEISDEGIFCRRGCITSNTWQETHAASQLEQFNERHSRDIGHSNCEISCPQQINDDCCLSMPDERHSQLYHCHPQNVITTQCRYSVEDESCVETDRESSYMRTDEDDDTGNTEWDATTTAAAAKRSINR